MSINKLTSEQHAQVIKAMTGYIVVEETEAKDWNIAYFQDTFVLYNPKLRLGVINSTDQVGELIEEDLEILQNCNHLDFEVSYINLLEKLASKEADNSDVEVCKTMAESWKAQSSVWKHYSEELERSLKATKTYLVVFLVATTVGQNLPWLSQHIPVKIRGLHQNK